MQVSRQPILMMLILSICFVAAILFTALEVSQDEFYLLFGLISIAFGSLYGLYTLNIKNAHVTWLVGLAIGVRVCLIWVDPILSDDIYRFIWDGMLWHDGTNPFAYTPSQLLAIQDLGQPYQEIYPLLNSQNYYTIYPPVCQLVFWLSTFEWLPSWLFGAPLIKFVFVIAEVVSILLLWRILKFVNLDKRNILLYALNPLIVLEFCGNLHFEALMICFLLFMIYSLMTGRLVFAGIGFGLAVTAKLLPLMFGPFLLLYLGFKRGMKFFIPAGIVVISSFSLMLGEHLSSLLASTHLYFQTFEFNASVYYLVRWVVGSAVGYNPIGFVGPLLSLLGIAYILMLSWSGRGYSQFQKIHIKFLLVIFTLYLIFATTIHPWYVSTLVALGVLTGLRFPIAWSFTIFLSYSAYIADPVVENPFFIFIEYLVVVGVCYWDYRQGHFKQLLRLMSK